VLNPRRSAKESRKYGHSEQEHLTYLFIHACLHLKGLDHGEAMEREEQKYLKQFA
jgi:rRNA maturation RNase YbeY